MKILILDALIKMGEMEGNIRTIGAFETVEDVLLASEEYTDFEFPDLLLSEEGGKLPPGNCRCSLEDEVNLIRHLQDEEDLIEGEDWNIIPFSRTDLGGETIIYFSITVTKLGESTLH
jgi:hypothetical protein